MFGKAVFYNGGAGKEKEFALVTADHGGGTVDLLVADANGAWTRHTSVPHREPADYGPEGGGVTWHNG